MQDKIKLSTAITAIGFFSAVSLYEVHYHHKYSLNNALELYGFKKTKEKEAFYGLLQQASISFKERSYNISFSFEQEQNQLASDILQLVKETQSQFTMRKGTQERWETKATDWMLKNKDYIYENMVQLGFVQAVKPNIQNPDAVCILGATRKRMKTRICYADELIKNGLRTNNIILLAGERYVTVNVDASQDELQLIANKFNLSDWSKLTETYLIKELYDSSSLSRVGIPVSVIDTPRGELPRPTTQTTILSLIEWLNKNKEIKSILFISNQPHVHYQNAIIKAILKESKVNINFEVVGSMVEEQSEVKSLLEGLGSYIFAQTPTILSSLNLKITDESIKKSFRDLYSANPLIYKTLPESLKSMDSPIVGGVGRIEPTVKLR